MRNILTAALAAGAMLDAGTALANPPTAAPTATSALSNNQVFGWDTTNLLPRQIAVDAYGQIYCNNCGGGSGGGGNSAAGTTGVAVPGAADYLGFSVGGTLVGVSAANPLPISGTLSTSPSGTQAVSGTLSIGNFPGTQAVSAAASGFADGALATQGTKADVAWTGTGSGSEIAIEKAIYGALVAPLPAGTNALGSVTISNSPTVNLAASSTVTLAAGASTIGTVALSSNTVTLAAGSSNIGTIGAIASNVAGYLQAVSSGGFSVCRAINAAASTMSGNCKASPGLVYHINVTTTVAAGVTLRIYATSTTPTVGSGTPVYSCIASLNEPCQYSSDVGQTVATGIGYTVTGGFTDTDTTTITTAGSVHVDIGYK